MISRRPQAKANRLWMLWCDTHPAPRITAAFLVVVLMLAALALTRSGHVTGSVGNSPMFVPLSHAQAAA